MITASTAPIDHRVAHRRRRLAHERRLVVDRLQRDAGRQRLPDRLHGARDAVGDRHGVAVHLTRDVQQRRGPAVARHDAHVVLRAHLHRRDVAHAQAATHHDVGDVLDLRRLLRRHDEVLLVVLRDAPHRAHRRRRPDRVREIVVRQPLLARAAPGPPRPRSRARRTPARPRAPRPAPARARGGSGTARCRTSSRGRPPRDCTR